MSDRAGALLKGFTSILEAVGSHRRDLGGGGHSVYVLKNWGLFKNFKLKFFYY